jgi:predicted LPLAT superfamily acyltransferase
MDQKEWSGQTGGTDWMQNALVVLFRIFPLWFMYGILALFIPFYMIFNHKEYVAIYRYFHLHRKQRRLQAFVNVYRNHYIFAEEMFDRFAFYAGKHFKISGEGWDLLKEQLKEPGGFIMLSSHVGNFELAGYTLKMDGKRINSLVYSGEKKAVMEQRRKALAKQGVRMVPVSEDMSHLFIINSALGNGEVVSMPGDRVFGSQKAAECRFIDAPAKFPLGPFALSVQLDAPIISAFVMKTGWKSYYVIVKRVECESNAKGREKMANLAQIFASQLEEVVNKYPLQWFNYFNFWND